VPNRPAQTPFSSLAPCRGSYRATRSRPLLPARIQRSITAVPGCCRQLPGTRHCHCSAASKRRNGLRLLARLAPRTPRLPRAPRENRISGRSPPQWHDGSTGEDRPRVPSASAAPGPDRQPPSFRAFAANYAGDTEEGVRDVGWVVTHAPTGLSSSGLSPQLQISKLVDSSHEQTLAKPVAYRAFTAQYPTTSLAQAEAKRQHSFRREWVLPTSRLARTQTSSLVYANAIRARMQAFA
jgi:hypothetical protein